MTKDLKTITYKDNDVELGVNISLEERTAWLSTNDIAKLFSKDKSVISRNIKNLYKYNQLNEGATVAKNATVQIENGRSVTRTISYYNMQVVLEIGNRVKSNKGILLKQFVEEYLNVSNDNVHDVIIYDNNGVNLTVNVSPKESTVYLTIDQMATLFDRERTVIYKHIKNVFDEGELDEKSNLHFLQFANSDKPVPVYNLDVIISVGYRVKSLAGVAFRKWATKVLKNIYYADMLSTKIEL